MYKHEMKMKNGTLTVELNKFAKQAAGSVMIGFNNTRVLVTACHDNKRKDMDFFPLIVNYDEKLYSAGKIPGNYKRREAQPSEQATLAARMIDRPIRPLFPQGYKEEVQIVCTVLAHDEFHPADTFATIGASLSLMLAPNIPFEGPISCVNVGYIDGEYILNPTNEQMKVSDLELKIAGSTDAINMVEAKSNEVSEEVMIDALLFGHNAIIEINAFQNEVLKAVGSIKNEYVPVVNEDLAIFTSHCLKTYSENMKTALCVKLKHNRADALGDLKSLIADENPDAAELGYVSKAFSEIEKEVFRELIVNDKYRVDGRKINELRDLTSELDLLPVVHSSAMFTRGETQVLSVATLGVKSDAQTFDGLESEEVRPFMLHYNFPPFSVGECGRMGAPGRREIGHGNLAQRALEVVMPTVDEFPYTVRVVSEVLESNGSSSQATICSASMALMRAGVPIKKPVAGIAMGLISNGSDYTILTDIQGLEDHLGDMDFKVAGTKDGICAIQMDIKIKGISREILVESLSQAHVARQQILDNMNQTISAVSDKLPESVPKVVNIKIEVAKIRDVIGKGGEMINKIIEDTGVKIDIEEDGEVFIYGTDESMVELAKKTIEKIAKTYKKDEEYPAEIVKIEKFGAFVKFEDTEALLHISELSDKRVEKVEDIINLGDSLVVSIKEVDMRGRIKVGLVKVIKANEE